VATEQQWEVAQVQLPEVVTDLASALNGLIGALIAILDIALAVLRVVKAFLVGFLDPIAAIIAAIIAEIEGLLNDIRQIGVYFSGDLDVEPPFDELLGGFTAYERRMVGRLTDRTDPTRPAFSSRTACVAVFSYASFDTTSIQMALAFISQIRKFFGLRGRTRTYTIPTGLNVSYGSASTGLGAFGLIGDIFDKGEDPSVASVRWQMAAPAGAGAVSWPLPSPAGFLVEVSTVPDGLYLAYLTPPKDSQSSDEVEMGLVAGPDGRPFKLYGGASILKEDSSLVWRSSGDTYFPPAGDRKTRFFAYRSAADNVPIPISALQMGDKAVLQRTFFVDVKTVLGINVAAPGQQFSTLLRYEDMPYDATFEVNADDSVTVTLSEERARDVYVRVSAVTSAVVASSPQASSFYWSLSEGNVQAESFTQVRLALTSAASSDKSDASAPLQVTFPSELTSQYLECVATALAVLVLSRSDLLAQGDDASFELDTAAQETGLEDLARYLVPLVYGRMSPGEFLKKNFPDVSSFRGKIRKRCLAVANMLLASTGPLPSAVLNLVLDRAQVTVKSGVVRGLADITWNDLAPSYDIDATILDAMDPSTDAGSAASTGVAPNPLSIGKLDPTFLASRFGVTGAAGIPLARTPGFAVPPEYVDERPADAAGELLPVSMGSADDSPVIYSLGSPSQAAFCRNVFLDNPEILTASQLVLNVAASTMTKAKRQGGAWLNYRLFPQGLPPVEAALNEIVAFLNAIEAGLAGILDAIVAYISYIEARILELEALLRRLQGLLDLILSIDVPPMATLIVTANGTNGILQALLTAENKPADTTTTVSRIKKDGEVVVGGAYGIGTVLLAGGLPSSVVDLLRLIFPPEE